MALTKARNSTIDIDSIEQDNLTDACVGTDELQDGSVTEAKLDPGLTFDTDRIVDEAITTAKIEDGAVTSDKLADDISLFTINNALTVLDTRSSGTDGTSLTGGSYNTREFQVELNTISGASVGSNQITLPAGLYYIDASAASGPTGSTASYTERLRLYNLTTGSTAKRGLSFSHTSDDDDAVVEMKGVFSLASTSVLELQHYISTNGQAGRAVNDGEAEEYLQATIFKVG